MSQQEVFDRLKYRIEVDKDGTRRYYDDVGQFHRTDGAAIEWADGRKEWYQNGLRHRTDGPAVDNANGFRAWYQNGLLHRDDGPAIEYADGGKSWWRNNQRMTEEEFNQSAKLYE